MPGNRLRLTELNYLKQTCIIHVSIEALQNYVTKGQRMRERDRGHEIVTSQKRINEKFMFFFFRLKDL